MKKTLGHIVSFVFLALALASCGGGGGGGGGGGSAPTDRLQITGTVSPPAGVPPSSLTAISLGSATPVSSQGTYMATVYKDGVTVVSALQSGRSFGLMNVVSSSSSLASSAHPAVSIRSAYSSTTSSDNIVLNAMTTAVSLVFLNPYLLTTNPARASQILSIIENDPQVTKLGGVISTVYSYDDPLGDPSFQQAMIAALQSVLDALSALSPAKPIAQRSAKSSPQIVILPKKSILNAISGPSTSSATSYYSDQDYITVTASQDALNYNVTETSKQSGSVDWIAEVMEIDTSSYLSFGAFQSDALNNRHIYSTERINVLGKINAPARSLFRFVDVIKLGMDTLFNYAGFNSQGSVKISATEDGLYLVRSYSGAWGKLVDSEEKSFVRSQVPNGSSMDTLALSENITLVALETLSVFIDIKSIVDEQLFKVMIQSGYDVAKRELGAMAAGPPSANQLLGVVTDTFAAMGSVVAEDVLKKGLFNIFGTSTKAALRSLLDYSGKISNAGQAVDRVDQLLISATPMETALVIVGNPFTTAITPGAISVNPASGSWTSTPQNLAVSSSGATAIYYTMVNTTDGSIPADPREPTFSDNDGSVPVSGGAGTFQLYATTGQNKQSKLRFKGYNSAGAGPASGVYSYSINLISGPALGAISVSPASGSWTSTPQNLSVSSSNSTIIYYTMVNTYDGSTPADPRDPTSSDNDGSVTVSGGAGTFQLYATAGQNKRSKLRFRGYNSAGAGPASGVSSYSIDLSSPDIPGVAFATAPSGSSWTSSPQRFGVGCYKATAVYFTMVNTYDGSTPADPRIPTDLDNDGYISDYSINPQGSFEGYFDLYASTGQYKRSNLRFRGYNSAGAGADSGVYSYSINLSSDPPSSLPGFIFFPYPSVGNLWASPLNTMGVGCLNGTSIYFTMVNTYDGSTPADPREPTSSDNDGSAYGVSSYDDGSGVPGKVLGYVDLYASAGQLKMGKLRFRCYNSAGIGIDTPTGAWPYTINLRDLPGNISVNPSSGSWTTTPQNLVVSSSYATTIYYTMVNTYDGTMPADPREPTSSDNDGSISVPGGRLTFQGNLGLYATAGQYKRSKLRFRAYNTVGAGPASAAYSYSIDLR